MTTRRPDPFGSSFVLDEARAFMGTLVWAPREYLDTMLLVIALTHVLGASRMQKREILSSVPHVLVTSQKWGVGKSTFAAQVPMMLASEPWQIGKGTTEPAINSKFLSDVADALVLDDAGKVFGDNGLGGRLSKLYDLLVKCYLRSGVISVSVNRVAKDLKVFAVAFMNGLEKSVPDDLRDRSIVMEMNQVKPPQVKLADALSPDTAADAEELREHLAGWAGRNLETIRLFLRDDAANVHPAMDSRVLQKWGGLFAVAHAAGGTWPQRCMDAFLLLALGSSQRAPLMRWQQVLLDTADIIKSRSAPGRPVTRIFTVDLVRELRALPEGQYYDQASTQYLVERLLPRALGPAADMRGTTLDGDRMHGKGRFTEDILRAAAVLYAQLHQEGEPAALTVTQQEMLLTPAGR